MAKSVERIVEFTNNGDRWVVVRYLNAEKGNHSVDVMEIKSDAEGTEYLEEWENLDSDVLLLALQAALDMRNGVDLGQ